MYTDSFRVFPDGLVIGEDDFDNGNEGYQYYDDYEEIEVPEDVIYFIVDEFDYTEDTNLFGTSFRLYDDDVVRHEDDPKYYDDVFIAEITLQEEVIDFIKENF